MMALRAMVLAMRPKQWTKNLIILLPFAFTLNLYWDFGHMSPAFGLLGRSLEAFFLFCLVSSGIYIVNDIADLESDKNHPVKRTRPFASGALSVSVGAALAAALLGGSVAAGLLLEFQFGIIMLAYVGLMLAYTFGLKQMVILDVLAIALGFVLRVVAGAFIINVPVSPWLYICTILGALFIGFAKRRNELFQLGEAKAASHRGTLEEYSLPLLDQMIAVMTPSILVAYSLYAATADVPREMLLTIPFVIYGILRYLYLMHAKNLGGAPEDILLSDRPLLADILLWLALSGAILFLFR